MTLGPAANEAVGQPGGEQANHDGPGGGAQVARLPLHRAVSRLFRHRVRRLDLHGAHGHLFRQTAQTHAPAHRRAHHRKSRRRRTYFPTTDFRRTHQRKKKIRRNERVVITKDWFIKRFMGPF